MELSLKITLATTWNELTEFQLCEISTALDHYHKFKDCHPAASQPALYSKLYVVLVKSLLRTNNFISVWFALRKLSPEFYEEYVQFLCGEIQRTAFLPAFKFKGNTYFPPANRLQNLTIKEFSFVDSLYYNWKKTQDVRFLDMLCATLYRTEGPKDPFSIDIRKPFNKIFVEKDTPLLSGLPYFKKIAIAYCYEGSRNYIVKQYPHIFPKPEKQDPEEKVKTKQIYTPFLKLLHYKIAFDPSKIERTQDLNVHDFFGPYENELIEMKTQKR